MAFGSFLQGRQVSSIGDQKLQRCYRHFEPSVIRVLTSSYGHLEVRFWRLTEKITVVDTIDLLGRGVQLGFVLRNCFAFALITQVLSTLTCF